MNLSLLTDKEEKIRTIEAHFEKILEALGLDPNDESLAKTPRRIADMYVNELFCGLDPENFPEMSTLEDSSGNLVLVKEITVNSMCEHHFVPMTGTASVAYLPQGKILGLSKINRLVDYFCRRPQLQERLTNEIADSLSLILGTEDVAVAITATHACVTMRGIKDKSSITRTHALRGAFQSDSALRSELFSHW
jgi:GTP cyclohydrolase IA